MTLNRMMSALASSLAMGGGILVPTVAQAEVFELRTYTTNEGKLDNLNARFRDHTIALFDKHGMESVGYWVPTDEPQSANTLIYVLRHESREAAGASWKAFIEDPAWAKVAEESQKDGRILAKAPESVYMEAAEYSPDFTSGQPGDEAAAVGIVAVTARDALAVHLALEERPVHVDLVEDLPVGVIQPLRD